eukprot:01039.XXX_1268_1437_1 [CDS] Oithona nana genome sequencing.
MELPNLFSTLFSVSLLAFEALAIFLSHSSHTCFTCDSMFCNFRKQFCFKGF